MSDFGTVGFTVDQASIDELYNQYLQAAYGITKNQLEDLKRRMDAQAKLFAVHKIFGDGWTMSEHGLRRSWIEQEIPTGEVGYTRGGKKWRFISATRAKRYSS